MALDPEEQIEFFSEEIEFQLSEESKIRQWIAGIIRDHNYQLESLTYIFSNDEYIHQINLEYLNHDTFTDIITFDNSDSPDIIEGDIFISIDRVKDNAQSLNIPFLEELHRVMAHGLLHLLGFDDKTPSLKQQMSDKENECLSLL